MKEKVGTLKNLEKVDVNTEDNTIFIKNHQNGGVAISLSSDREMKILKKQFDIGERRKEKLNYGED